MYVDGKRVDEGFVNFEYEEEKLYYSRRRRSIAGCSIPSTFFLYQPVVYLLAKVKTKNEKKIFLKLPWSKIS